MKKETILVAGITLVVGLLVGIIFMQVTGDKKAGQTGSAPPSAVPPTAAVNPQQIRLLEDIVAKDPGNRNAWVQLGNIHFDSNQPVKAVEAYGKALELDPNDPNVLTDQGVMFRRLGWYDRAVDNFLKASTVDPSHQQSLYNLGIVYRYDLQDFGKAIEAWKKFMALNPQGPAADQVRAEIEFMETQTSSPSR